MHNLVVPVARLRYTRVVTDDEPEVSDQVLTERLGETTRRVEDGELARMERDRLMLEAQRRKWKQSQIAAATGMTQQGVSKRLRYLAENPPDQGDHTTE